MKWLYISMLTCSLMIVDCAAYDSRAAQMMQDSLNELANKKPKALPKRIKPTTVVKQDEKTVPADAVVVDQVVALLYGPEKTIAIKESDVKKLSIDAHERDLRELIGDWLMFFEAQRHHIMVDEHMVERYLMQMQKAQNLTQDDIRTMFSSAGYTYEEGIEELKKVQSINSLMEQMLTRIIIPDEDVQAYYKENPTYEPAEYVIEEAVVPFSVVLDREDQRRALEHFANTGEGGAALGVYWDTPYRLNEDQMGDAIKFVTTMKIGAIWPPKETQYGFELVRLKEKTPERLVPLEERYRYIVHQLRLPKYEQMMEELQMKLLKEASIVFYTEEGKALQKSLLKDKEHHD